MTQQRGMATQVNLLYTEPERRASAIFKNALAMSLGNPGKHLPALRSGRQFGGDVLMERAASKMQDRVLAALPVQLL